MRAEHFVGDSTLQSSANFSYKKLIGAANLVLAAAGDIRLSRGFTCSCAAHSCMPLQPKHWRHDNEESWPTGLSEPSTSPMVPRPRSAITTPMTTRATHARGLKWQKVAALARNAFPPGNHMIAGGWQGVQLTNVDWVAGVKPSADIPSF